MANKVEICNIALSHVGAYPINSLSESSKEALECNRFYNLALDGVLEDHDWSFARKRLTLALLTTTYTGWDYAYQVPTDCVVPREILDETGTYTGTSYDIDLEESVPTGKVKYELASNNTLDSKIILTDKAEAELLYTARVTDTNMYTNKFVESLALKLGSYLAQPLKARRELTTSLFELYRLSILNAKGVDANSDYKKERSINNFVNARN